MTIQQTVTIPDDRLLSIQLPQTAPAGRMRVHLVVMPFAQDERREQKPLNPPLTVREAAEQMERGGERQDSSRRFAGCLKGKGVFAGDPVSIQRKMRDEWG